MDDACRAIVDRHDVDRTGQLRTNSRQNFVDRFRHLNGVCTGAAIHCDNCSRRRHLTATHPKAHVYAFVLDRVFDRGYVAQVHRRVVRAANDQVGVLFRSFELTLRTQDRGL